MLLTLNSVHGINVYFYIICNSLFIVLYFLLIVNFIGYLSLFVAISLELTRNTV